MTYEIRIECQICGAPLCFKEKAYDIMHRNGMILRVDKCPTCSCESGQVFDMLCDFVERQKAENEKKKAVKE